MDLWFIFAIIWLLLSTPIWLATRRSNAGPQPSRKDYPMTTSGAYEHEGALRRWETKRDQVAFTKTIARFVMGFGIFLLAMSLWVQVPTNAIGIFTSFGKPVDARQNGFHLKRPWEKVVKFDASRQYLKFCGKGNDKAPTEDGKEFPAIKVKMEREARADVCVVIAWQLRAGTAAERKQAVELFRAHKTFDRLTENYMKANAQSAAVAVYDNVNPLVPEKNPSFGQLSQQLEFKLRGLVGNEVTIISAQVTGVDYDDATDKRIADMQAEFAKTEQAKQQEQTNRAISAANKALVEQGKLTPEVLQDQCIRGAIAVGANPGACLQPGWGGFGSPAQPATK